MDDASKGDRERVRRTATSGGPFGTAGADRCGGDTARPPKWLLIMMELRAPFLTASVVPVLVGAALAFHHTGRWDWPLFVLTLAAMALVHSGANVANDYFDHRSGNDEANTDFVRPFTGGSRMIQKGLLSPREVLALSLVCFGLGSAIGVYLVYRTGLLILVLGMLGVAGGFFYTAPPLFLVSRGVGEFVIGLNFGILPVVGTYYIQTGVVRWEVVLFSLPVAVLISAILFINQFQDFEADRAVGKRNWVVRLGRRRSAAVFSVLMSIWTAPVIVAVVLKLGPVLCLLALLPFVMAWKAIRTAGRHHDHPRQLTPANALTVLTHLALGLLLAGTLVVARFRTDTAARPAVEANVSGGRPS
ncbi:MAG: 1,4-dihydroxy-2-naphthoate octaprenyltransferase [Kiritimatiellae bacterium]|nr:1,4-dihydroxy-2-naphthoate octaprenyltransferase [Kiritimatiellia bacterium]